MGLTRVATVQRALSYRDSGLTASTTYLYGIRETARDGTTNVASATVWGATANQCPIANAWPDQSSQTGVSVTCNGSSKGGGNIDEGETQGTAGRCTCSRTLVHRLSYVVVAT
jgi:hypothetical protein